MSAIGTLQPGGADPGPTPSLLNKNAAQASQEFESVLLGQWLQGAENSFGSMPGEQDDDAGDSQMREFATQHLATELARSGGIGIAKIVEGALIKSAGMNVAATESSQHAAAAGVVYRNSGVNDGKR
jgi:Rod binding domain-containing protein